MEETIGVFLGQRVIAGLDGFDFFGFRAHGSGIPQFAASLLVVVSQVTCDASGGGAGISEYWSCQLPHACCTLLRTRSRTSRACLRAASVPFLPMSPSMNCKRCSARWLPRSD